MATIKWLPEASDDLRRLHAFLSANSQVAAANAIKSIVTSVSLLTDFPEAGKPWEHDFNYRELTARFGAKGYVVRYRVIDDNVIIVRVWHGLEDR